MTSDLRPPSPYGLSGLFTAAGIGKLAVIGAIVGVAAILFAWAGGWLSPHRLSPARMIDTFEAVNGHHPGFRRNHAKGVCLSGYFDSNGAGARYSRARVFRQGRVPLFGRFALAGGMPPYKYVANRALTFTQNILMGAKLSEYHSGYRAWTRQVLERLPLGRCSDDFVFDNQMLALALHFGYRIGEISCPTKYFPEASSINLRRSVVYGLGVIGTSLQYRLHRAGLRRSGLFDETPR